MTFDASETGATTGRPVELYTFNFPDGTMLRTSYDEDYAYGGLVYSSCVISHAEIESVQLGSSREVVIKLPINDAVVVAIQNFGVSARGIEVTIDTLHTTDSGATLRRKSRGKIATVDCRDTWASIHAHFLLDLQLDVMLPIAQGQPLCNHMFGDTGCGKLILNTALLPSPPTVVAISVDGLTITMSNDTGAADGYFNNGAVTYSGEPRTILTHVGNDITLDTPFPAGFLPIGGALSLIPGCDHTIDTCLSKHNNVPNFGGAAEIPLANPTAPDGLGIVVQT